MKAKFTSENIILSDGWLDAWMVDVNGGFRHYLDELLDGGFFFSSLPDYFIELYNLSVYVAEIENGGHRQYLDNLRGRTAESLLSAEKGATRIGSAKLKTILCDFAEWVQQNPDIALSGDVMGMWQQPSALQELDQRFFSTNFDQDEFDQFIASQGKKFQRWIKAKRKSTDPSRFDEHAIRSAAFILQHVNTRIVPHKDYLSIIKEIVSSQQDARHGLLAQRYKRVKEGLPPKARFALAVCLRQAGASSEYELSETWEVLEPLTDYSVEVVRPSVSARFMLTRQSDVFTLTERFLSWGSLWRDILWKLGKQFGLLSDKAITRAEIPPQLAATRPDYVSPWRHMHFVDGKEVGRTVVDFDPRAMMENLFIPAAICQFDPLVTVGFGFANGALQEFSFEAQKLSWQYRRLTEDGKRQDVLLEANQQEIVFTIVSTSERAVYSSEQLEEWTKERETFLIDHQN